MKSKRRRQCKVRPEGISQEQSLANMKLTKENRLLQRFTEEPVKLLLALIPLFQTLGPKKLLYSLSRTNEFRDLTFDDG